MTFEKASWHTSHSIVFPSLQANDLSELKIKMSLQMLSLKRLNRLDKMRTKWSREETNGTKQNVDAFNLQLQNLLYEVLHLRKEITKCQQYRSY